jgi:hypothetical protein
MGRSAIAYTVAATLVESIAGVLKERAHATIVPSAGRTHVDTFAILRAGYAQALDWSRVICLQMDEYADIGSADGRSLSAQIESEFVAPLRIGRYLRFFDASGRAERTLEAYEQEIAALGGVDCAIHGVGVNAHIGFNEPGAIHSGRTRRVELARATQRANELYAWCHPRTGKPGGGQELDRGANGVGETLRGPRTAVWPGRCAQPRWSPATLPPGCHLPGSGGCRRNLAAQCALPGTLYLSSRRG